MSDSHLKLRTTSQQERAQATVDTLVETAIQIVREKDLDQASPSAISKKSGFAIGTIYRYFADKTSIFIAAFDYLTRKQHAATIKKIELFPDAGTSRQFAMFLAENYIETMKTKNPKFVIPVYRSYLKRSPAPEKFAQHIDVLLQPTLNLMARNTSNTFREFDEYELKLCYRGISAMLSSGFYEEDFRLNETKYLLHVTDSIYKLLSR